MNEIKGNVWAEKGDSYVVIPTNGFVKRDGYAVMGRGLAYQANTKYFGLSKWLGDNIKAHGNRVFEHVEHRLITFPVKHAWWHKADLELICLSCENLRYLWKNRTEHILMPHVGCGNGQRDWLEVKEILDTYFGSDPRITIIDL